MPVHRDRLCPPEVFVAVSLVFCSTMLIAPLSLSLCMDLCSLLINNFQTETIPFGADLPQSRMRLCYSIGDDQRRDTLSSRQYYFIAQAQ
jgi:hypothetical protein